LLSQFLISFRSTFMANLPLSDAFHQHNIEAHLPASTSSSIAQTPESQRAVGQDDLSQPPIPSKTPMARSAKLKATAHSRGVAQRPAKQKTRYAPEPTAEEYKTFPPGYRREGGLWPAEEILDIQGADGPEKKRRYLIQWEPHPHTHQYFEPTWVLFFYLAIMPLANYYSGWPRRGLG
jgi:hypothetical protein